MRVMGIDHIAVALNDLENGLRFWRDALGLSVETVRDEPEQGVEVAFLPLGAPGGGTDVVPSDAGHRAPRGTGHGVAIELVRPLGQEGGVARFLERSGPGIHHVCLTVDDLDGALERFRELGVATTTSEPLVNAAGRRMVFVHPRSTGGVLVELYESASSTAGAG